MKKIFLFISISILYIQTNPAQSLNKAKLDSLFNALDVNKKAMGSVAIRKNGELIYTKTIGCSECKENNMVAATNNTIYRVGSISKMFTTVMILQLVEEGKLNLDKKLDSYYPEITNAKSITIGNLLNHHSGIHDFTSDPSYTSWMEKPKTHEEMIAMIAKSPADFEPGTKGEYSNSNFIILGYIIEKITGNTYKDELNKRIINKLGLTSTYMGEKMQPKEAYSYSYLNGWKPESITDMSIPGGAGAIVSTPSDLTKFIDALFNNKLIKASSLELMKTQKDDYGMGMFEFPFGERKAYGHNGGIDGFSSVVGYFPGDKIAISYITNGQVYPMNDILIGILSILFDTPYKIPNFKSYAVTTEELDQYLGTYKTEVMPIKITITKNLSTLLAQATGQPAFPLDAKEKDVFAFDQAGIVLVFDTQKKEMILRQGGGEFIFVKE